MVQRLKAICVCAEKLTLHGGVGGGNARFSLKMAASHNYFVKNAKAGLGTGKNTPKHDPSQANRNDWSICCCIDQQRFSWVKDIFFPDLEDCKESKELFL